MLCSYAEVQHRVLKGCLAAVRWVAPRTVKKSMSSLQLTCMTNLESNLDLGECCRTVSSLQCTDKAPHTVSGKFAFTYFTWELINCVYFWGNPLKAGAKMKQNNVCMQIPRVFLPVSFYTVPLSATSDCSDHTVGLKQLSYLKLSYMMISVTHRSISLLCVCTISCYWAEAGFNIFIVKCINENP